MLVPIFFAIIIAELFSRFYVPLGDDKNTFVVFLWLAIRGAGMIDVACDILSVAAIDGQTLVKLEEIFATTADHFFFSDYRAPIFGYDFPLLHRPRSE